MRAKHLGHTVRIQKLLIIPISFPSWLGKSDLFWPWPALIWSFVI